MTFRKVMTMTLRRICCVLFWQLDINGAPADVAICKPQWCIARRERESV